MDVVSHHMLNPGDVVAGKYVLRERIGEGGMGVVFLADQPALARSVAIKLVHPSLPATPELAQQFRDEAVAGSRVHHPGSVAVIDCDVLRDGTPFIVMEHVRGRPLARIIAEEEIPLPRALALIGQVLDVLEATHRNGVVHADIKSDNFLVAEVDGGDHVTLIDFGLARVEVTPRARPASRATVVSGTPEYMAPEVVQGAAPSPASDLYAAGVILYELLTGTTPFAGGSTDDIMARQIHEIVIPPSLRQPDRDIPTAIDHLVLRALDKQPETRFADAGELARALRAVGRAHAASRARATARPSTKPSDIAVPGSPTRNYGSARRRFARGSSSHAPGRLQALRRAIGGALIRGDIAAIADGYGELAAALVRDHQFAAAVHELEEGIDVVTAGRGPAEATGCGPLDRLVVALAALYDEAGERQRARHVVAPADRHPTLTYASR